MNKYIFFLINIIKLIKQCKIKNITTKIKYLENQEKQFFLFIIYKLYIIIIYYKNYIDKNKIIH